MGDEGVRDRRRGGMAFINLRRKKGIYLGGDTRVGSLSLSSLSPSFSFLARFPSSYRDIVCVLRRETERGLPR